MQLAALPYINSDKKKDRKQQHNYVRAPEGFYQASIDGL